MELVKWNDRFNIGVEVVDKAHKKLFSIVHKINRLSEESQNNEWACMEGIKYFKRYALNHFAQEEAYMKSIQYSGYAMHKRLHDNMCDLTLPILEMDLVRSNYSEEALGHFLGFCTGWLTQHILIDDFAITGKCKVKWVHEPKEEEISVLKNTIVRVFDENFRLETWIASKYYCGEHIGKAVYYRLNYDTKDGKKQQILLAFEERLFLKMAERMLHRQFPKMDGSVVDVIGVVFRQFVGHVGKNLEFADLYKLEKDNVLTEDQFVKAFEKEYPYQSMLFDSHFGFFAFCIRK